MKKLFLISLISVSSMLGYSQLENQLFDAINNRDEKWAKDLILEIGDLSDDFKKAVTKEAEKAIDKYRHATKNMDHSYGDQWVNFLGKSILFPSLIAVPLGAVSRHPIIIGAGVGGTILGGYLKYRAYYCMWAYKNLRQAQGVMGVIADAKVKEHEEKKHNNND